MADKPAILPCIFLPETVLCSFRKSEHLAILEACLTCGHYLRFVAELEEEEDQFWAEQRELWDDKHA